MVDVQFNEGLDGGSLLYTKLERSSERPRMVAWMMRKGIVRTDSQALGILICVIIFSLSLGIYLMIQSDVFSAFQPDPPQYEVDIRAVNPGELSP